MTVDATTEQIQLRQKAETAMKDAETARRRVYLIVSLYYVLLVAVAGVGAGLVPNPLLLLVVVFGLCVAPLVLLRGGLDPGSIPVIGKYETQIQTRAWDAACAWRDFIAAGGLASVETGALEVWADTEAKDVRDKSWILDRSGVSASVRHKMTLDQRRHNLEDLRKELWNRA